MNQIKFKVGEREYPIKLDYYRAGIVLPEKFGINVISMFADELEAEATMRKIALDEMETIKIIHYFMDDGELEDLLKVVTTKEITDFRERFWDAVANFIDPLKRELVLQMWKMFKKDLKVVDLEELAEKNSTESSTEQSPEE